MAAQDALIIDGVRSPRGKGKSTGSLHHIHPQELLASVLNSLRDRVGFDARDVEDVIAGNGNQSGEHGADIARLSVLTAGWPLETPGVSLNRFCGSGQTAVNLAAMGIMSGQQDLVIGCGVESMSRWEDTAGATLDAGNENLRRQYPMVPQGISADLIATIEGFSREDVDSFAVTSQDRTAKAVAEGRFERSVVPVYNLDGSLALDHDEFPRPGSTVESLGKLAASFADMGTKVWPGNTESFDDMCRRVYPQVKAINHVHGPGNSSGVVDGAAAIVLASPAYAKAHGFKARGRIVQTALAGDEPVIMLTAPGPASRKVLKRAGMSVNDIDLWEINEAFAAIPMKAIRDLEIDPEKVNVNGGAIALGHPIGATGAILIQTLLDELEARDLTTGLVTMCTGGGMATATIIERI
jgi:acetyl-CoA C-acetyltransferase